MKRLIGEFDTNVCVVDLKASTQLKILLGTMAWKAVYDWYYSLIARTGLGNGGIVVKYTGDGAMLVFEDSAAAINWAIQVLESMEEAQRSGRIPSCTAGKVAVSRGKVLGTWGAAGVSTNATESEEWDVLGSPVDLAFELCDHAKPMALLVTNEVVHAANMRGVYSGRGNMACPRRDADQYVGRLRTLKNLKSRQVRYAEILWADRRFGVKGIWNTFLRLATFQI